MEMSGEHRIAAPREKVWAALNDPEILKASIPGCQALEKHSDTEMTAKVVTKIGPVKATFNGEVTLENIEPAGQLHDFRRRQGRRRRLRQGRSRRHARRGRRRHDPALYGQGPGWRQARPAWRPADRRHRQADGRRVLPRLRRAGEQRFARSRAPSIPSKTSWKRPPTRSPNWRMKRKSASRKPRCATGSAAPRCGACLCLPPSFSRLCSFTARAAGEAHTR